jgi:thiosulfate dehydrogenase [quinone] large subunit
MNKMTYLMLRFTIGTSMFGHGLVRLPKLSVFSNGMVAHFQKSFLPPSFVLAFSYALPFAEFIIGLLLLIGLFTKQALIAGVLVMIMLIFGSTTVENWDVISLQLMHVVFFSVLFQFISANSYAVDNIFKKSY